MIKLLNKSSCILLLSFFTVNFPLFAEKITFSASSMTGTAGNSNGKTTLSGNASVNTESMQISADTIELSGTDYKLITASGNISGTNLETKMTFTCQSMTYDRETKIALLENAVHLVDTENEVTADAEIIEYNQNTDVAIMQIQVSIVQKDNKCSATHAIYRKTEQMLEMSGNPTITQGSDTFRAQNISLNLETQEITLDGRVKGSVTTSSKENNDSSSGTENPASETEAKTEPELKESQSENTTEAANE